MTRARNFLASLARFLRPVPSFNAGEEAGSVVINGLSLAIEAAELNERNEVVALEVLPPPGAGGILPARDGRRQRIVGPSPRRRGTQTADLLEGRRVCRRERAAVEGGIESCWRAGCLAKPVRSLLGCLAIGAR